MNKQINIRTNLIIILFALCFLQVFFESLNIPVITSILFYLSIFGVFATWMFIGFNFNNKFNIVIFVSLLLSIVNVLVNLLISKGDYSLTYFNKIVFFIAFFVAYKNALEDMDTEKIKKWFLAFTIIFSLGYILLFFVRRDAMFYRANVGVQEYLTLNLENPNKGALYVVFFTMSNFLVFSQAKNVFLKIVSLIISGVYIYFAILTGSRNGIITTVIFIVFFLFVLIRRKDFKKKIPLWVNIVIAIFPFIFAILYLAVVDKQWVNEVFGFMINEGKTLDSRKDIWAKVFTVLKDYFLTGAYYQYGGSKGAFQLHNTHLDVIGAYGIVVFGIYVFFLVCVLHEISGKREISKGNLLFYVAFIITVLLGCAEAAMVNGSNGFFILTSVFIVFARDENLKPPQIKKELIGEEK